jgi:enoyl-CoA hydratase/carnithine racemase
MTASEPKPAPTPLDEQLVVTDADGVRTIRLNRPEARNALSRSVRIRLKEVVADAGTDDTVDVVVLTGTDPAFSGGVDLKEIRAGTAGDATTADEITDPAAVVRACPKPVIAAVNGVCVTGALELALSCDIIVASERARFADTHGKVGFRPAWGMSVFLPRAVGARKAIEMAITGRFLEADDALRCGLVNHVVAHDELMAFTSALAGDIRALDRETVRDLLALFRRTPGLTVDDALALERATVDAWMARRTAPS